MAGSSCLALSGALHERYSLATYLLLQGLPLYGVLHCKNLFEIGNNSTIVQARMKSRDWGCKGCLSPEQEHKTFANKERVASSLSLSRSLAIASISLSLSVASISLSLSSSHRFHLSLSLAISSISLSLSIASISLSLSLSLYMASISLFLCLSLSLFLSLLVSSCLCWSLPVSF